MSRALNRASPSLLAWRGQNAPEEWAVRSELERLIRGGRMFQVVEARTGGRCYVPGCPERISVYPHAIPALAGGSHHPINRLGVCRRHGEDLHAQYPGNQLRHELRRQLMV